MSTADSAPSTPTEPVEKRKLFRRFLDLIEWLGNLLPHPVSLFAE